MKINQAAAYGLHALMYMARHITQLPVTSRTIARAEGMPQGYMAKVLQRLVKAGFVRAVKGRTRGYVFAVPPEEIRLLDVLEALEGEPLFADCPLQHGTCGGTAENCQIYAQWLAACRRMRELLEETTVAAAAWNHPEHRFQESSRRATRECVR